MKKYNIVLTGCDATTWIEIDLTDEQVKLLQQISELSHEESEYDCMPVMDVKEVEE